MLFSKIFNEVFHPPLYVFSPNWILTMYTPSEALRKIIHPFYQFVFQPIYKDNSRILSTQIMIKSYLLRNAVKVYGFDCFKRVPGYEPMRVDWKSLIIYKKLVHYF